MQWQYGAHTWCTPNIVTCGQIFQINRGGTTKQGRKGNIVKL